MRDVISKVKILFYAVIVFLIAQVLQLNPAVPLLLVVLAIYSQYAYGNLKNRSYNLLNLTFLFVLIFSLGYIIIKQHLSIFLIPYALVPMLAVMLFDNLEISIILTLAISFCLASIAGNNYFVAVLSLISGILSCLLVKNARRRSVVIRSGVIIGLVQMLVLFLIERFKINNSMNYVDLFAVSVISSFIIVGILPIFEYLFKTVTNISLLELADFNNPLLQRMIMEAPGTYHHSLIVGNLSDAACKAIGAHELLARIGAYYHDIGKLSKPEYFSENIDHSQSKHEALTPAMSKMVIMNHVKEGIELAKKYRLKPSIVDFIQQHHGSSLVYYFYRRALENMEPDQEVEEEGFRYPGPKPDTKETAIVLLADSVEAAARSLQEPNPQKIEELVHKIINNKFIDGQLDECELTLKDLEKISEVFIRILSGVYHSRITYPESSNNNHTNSNKNSEIN